MLKRVGCSVLAIALFHGVQAPSFLQAASRNPAGPANRLGTAGSLDARPSRLFASSFNQGIVELDPATGAVMNTFAAPVENNVTDAMAFDGDRLYFFNPASDPNHIYELDPDTGAVTAPHPFQGNAFMEGMAALNGLLYILDRASDQIIVFDPGDDSLLGVLDVDAANPENPDANLAGGLAGITTGGDALIAGTAGDNIVEIDPASGQIVNAFAYTGSPAGGDIGLGVVNGEIFVGNNTGMTDQIVVYGRDGVESRRLTVAGSIGIQSIGADDTTRARPARILPQYADGPTGGFRNTTRIVVAAANQAESGEIRFFDPDGAPRSLSIGGETRNAVPFSLAPRGSVEIVTDGVGDLTSGTVGIFSERGASSRLSAAGVFGLLGFSVSVPHSPPRRAHRAYVSFNPEERTAIAVYNPDGERSVTLQLTLLDSDGAQRATAALTLEAGEQRAVFLDEETLFAQEVSAGFRGLVTATSETLPVSLLSLIQKTSTGALVVVALD